MNRKIVLMAVLVFMFSAICTTHTVPSMQAETNTTSTSEPLLLLEEPSFPKWFVDANGTVFQITNSSYLNVTLTSSENVHVLLESVPRVVSYHIKSLSSAISTELTLSGLIASTTYYRYQDGNLTESFITDSTGNYTYVQDISSPHHIFIVENITTIYIRPDGSIEPETAPIQRVGDIYTFTANIYETIIVQKSNIVIDGNGYTLKGRGAGSYPYVYGFYIHGVGSVVVRSTRVEAFTWGIYLSSSSNDMILNNNITDNNEGLNLVYSFNATLRNNHMSGGAPFVVEGNVLSDFIHDIDSSNTVNGKPIYYWVNQQDRIVPVDAGYVALVNSTNIKAQNLNLERVPWEGLLLAYTNNSLISGNNIRHTGNAIYSFVSSNNTISDNNIELWGMNGIYLLDSSNNMISGNNIAYSGVGIFLKSSSNNTISGNNIAFKNQFGILLGSSNNNTISDNNIMNCFLYGIAISESFLNIISSNNITNNRYPGIGLGLSSNNSISGNNITNNRDGIFINRAHNNSIAGNTITANERDGINHQYSSYNNIAGNNITANNGYGIRVRGSSNYNIIYHNNLIDNGVQAYDTNPANNNWHHPDLLEGNYWSDYPGVDDGSGTGKHAIADDGIGDTDIPWPAPDYDYYPFMSESGLLDTTPPEITIVTPEPYGLYMIGTALDFYATDTSGVATIVGQLTNTAGEYQEVDSGFAPQLGVYTLVVVATDNRGNTAESDSVFFVVYDPEGGFATGGGWISPDEESTLPGGKANFGFVTKIKQGSCTGNLEFQYHDAEINLKSTTIDWLVISGVSAQFQGTATINGEGLYTFRVTAKDNGEPGVGSDEFDIRIWEGTDTEADPLHKAKNIIAGGNIVVHKK